MSPEQLAAMRTELRAISNLALGIHERAVLMAHQFEELAKACSHPKATETTMMGAPDRQFMCPDCGESWHKPWAKSEKAEGV